MIPDKAMTRPAAMDKARLIRREVVGAALLESFSLARLRATASKARMVTVKATPTPIARVAMIPTVNRPLARVNSKTKIAPEQGLRPTATEALTRVRKPSRAAARGAGWAAS